jgi:hypothetical protein
MDVNEKDPNALNIDPVATDALLELSSAASSAASSSAPITPRRASRATGRQMGSSKKVWLTCVRSCAQYSRLFAHVVHDVLVFTACVGFGGIRAQQRCRWPECCKAASKRHRKGYCVEHSTEASRRKRKLEIDDSTASSSSVPNPLALTTAARAAICAPKTTQQRLTEGQRWAIIAYLADEKSFDWIAEKVNCDMRTVAQWASRFLLRAEL